MKGEGSKVGGCSLSFMPGDHVSPEPGQQPPTIPPLLYAHAIISVSTGFFLFPQGLSHWLEND